MRCSVFLGLIVAALAVGAALFRDKLFRLHNVNSLFKEDRIVSNFRSIHELGFPAVTVETRGGRVAEFDTVTDAPELPDAFEWQDMHGVTSSISLGEWLDEHWTTGLVVIKRDSPTKARLLHESYHRGNDVASRCVSWSMCKSVVSTLFGIAVDRGIISDIETAKVTDYVPEMVGSGYDGVRLKDVLQVEQ